LTFNGYYSTPADDLDALAVEHHVRFGHAVELVD
jgi:hypothetical protein